MITGEHITELNITYFHSCGLHEIDTSIDGTYRIGIGMKRSEWKAICEKSLEHIRLEEMKENGIPV